MAVVASSKLEPLSSHSDQQEPSANLSSEAQSTQRESSQPDSLKQSLQKQVTIAGRSANCIAQPLRPGCATDCALVTGFAGSLISAAFA
ncbi:hypothetical protein WJX74_000969 [Apatococcus lobatus]|uniref:Uncharacterized protein n=1 Tax=Apatococcus lobatus TaxID=904363 RepID=A0AAW1RW72_9CHLO